MGRFTVEQKTQSPFEITLEELIRLQRVITQGRSRLIKRHTGAALAHSKIRGRGMDFAETRNYHPGDDIRLMDWRVTARTNKPHVKVFQVERERPVMVFYDAAPSMYFGTRGCLKTVLAAQLAALLAWCARAHGDRVGGVVSSLEKHRLWLPHAHNSSLLNFLKAIQFATAQYSNPQWTDWQSTQNSNRFMLVLKELLKTLKPGTLILFISDWYYDVDLFSPYFLELRQHHDLIFYQVSDPFELSAPTKGVLPITDGIRILPLNFNAKNVVEQYQKACEERLEPMRRMAKKFAIPYHLVSVHSDLKDVVQQSLLRSLRG
jgi:uncharacterized protein (DUF58 family)